MTCAGSAEGQPVGTQRQEAVMRARGMFAMVGALLVAGVTATSSTAATGGAGGAGLWSATYAPAATDCGSFVRNGSNFCVADDPGSVELGVKFTTSKAVQISGVRFYRVDPGAQSGSLWAADGTLLATGSVSTSATDAWQDLTLASPVSVVPGTTYIASYHSPNAHYGFQYDYFTTASYTVGPITAKQSVEGDRNGVYCYVGEPCGLFPANSYRDLNYWVTPLWSYAFAGFYQPVDNAPVWNSAKAGSAIPVKFSLGGDQGTDVLQPGYPKVLPVTCPGSSATIDAIEQTVTAGGSSLSYDAAKGVYTYVWKTDKVWAGKCLQFELGLGDDTSHVFLVQFTR
jgi:hypothetical protein